MPRRSTLRFTRVTQASTCRANRFFLATETVAVKRAHFEMFEQQGGAIFFRPLPVIERRQRCRETVFNSGKCRSGWNAVLKRQRLGVSLACETAFDQRAERCREEQFSRRVRFERGANSRPRITSAFLRHAKLARRDIEKRSANRLTCRANCRQEHRFARFE